MIVGIGLGICQQATGINMGFLFTPNAIQ